MSLTDMTNEEKEIWEERKAICIVCGELEENAAEMIADMQIEDRRRKYNTLIKENKTLINKLECVLNDIEVLSSFLCIPDNYPEEQVKLAYEITNEIINKIKVNI